MATVSGTFTAVGLSAVLDVPAVDEEITISLTGTWVATVRLERELSPYSNSWEVIRSDTGNYSIVIKQIRKNERYRFNTVAYTSGTVSFSVADAVLVLTEVTDPNTGALLAHYDEDGFVVDGDFDVTGTFTPAGNVSVGGTLSVTGATTLSTASTIATGTTIGNLTLGDGSIVDSSDAISFGNEALTTTGTLASGALTVTGAISDSSASTFTTGATIGNLTLADGSITDSSNAISFGNEALTTTGIITGAGGRTTLNIGSVPGTVTAVEWGDGYNHVTVLTVTNAVLIPTIPADAEEVGALIYTFPAGIHRVNMTRLAITAATVATDAGNADLGCGSTLAAGDGTTLQLATDEDFINGLVVADMSSPSVDVTEAGDSTIFLAAGSKLFHINVASDWTATQASPTITGTVTIAWTFMGA